MSKKDLDGLESQLSSKKDFYDDPIEDIAFALAVECEEAELDPRGKVTINREKLKAIAARVLEKASAALSALDAGQQSQAALDVLAERQRQISVEGWGPEHDDRQDAGQIAAAAATYALSAVDHLNPHSQGDGAAEIVSILWPWDRYWWKPTTPRRNLVKAAALILAEVERLDRASGHELPVKERDHV